MDEKKADFIKKRALRLMQARGNQEGVALKWLHLAGKRLLEARRKNGDLGRYESALFSVSAALMYLEGWRNCQPRGYV